MPTAFGALRSLFLGSLFLAAALAAPLGLAGPAAALEVDLELVLAVDVSGSIDGDEYMLQKQGYAEAFLHPAVQRAILSTPNQRIAVTLVEWASPEQQKAVVPWTLISNAGNAAAFSEAIMRAPRSVSGRTSISGAIDFAMTLFGRGGFEGTRRVIDVSGDGVNNTGRSSAFARDDALRQGIVINGLVIMNDRQNNGRFGFFNQSFPPLDEFYRENVIGGPGAFLIEVDDFQSFAFAIVNKLIKEIAALPVIPAENKP